MWPRRAVLRLAHASQVAHRTADNACSAHTRARACRCARELLDSVSLSSHDSLGSRRQLLVLPVQNKQLLQRGQQQVRRSAQAVAAVLYHGGFDAEFRRDRGWQTDELR